MRCPASCVAASGRSGPLSLASIVAVLTPSLADHISIKPNRSRGVDLAIEPLNLGFEARKHVGALLEHLEIFDHRARSLGQPFTRNDGRDARRIDHPERCRNPPIEFSKR